MELKINGEPVQYDRVRFEAIDDDRSLMIVQYGLSLSYYEFNRVSVRMVARADEVIAELDNLRRLCSLCLDSRLIRVNIRTGNTIRYRAEDDRLIKMPGNAHITLPCPECRRFMYTRVQGRSDRIGPLIRIDLDPLRLRAYLNNFPTRELSGPFESGG
jgi:hypothetical protein